MDPKALLLIGLGSFFIFNKRSSYANTSIGRYVPPKQPSFKSQLDFITNDLEDTLNIPFLHDYLMCVAFVESRFIPSAIRYESGMGYYPQDFPKNPYKNQKGLWEYTGGLFQMFPYIGLSTNDGNARNLDPRTIFHPLYAITYAIDFAYRLNKKYDADRWLYIRFGWRSLTTLKNKPLDVTEAVQNRMINAADELGISTAFLYQHPNFDTYSKYQFSGTIKYLFSKYTKK